MKYQGEDMNRLFRKYPNRSLQGRSYSFKKTAQTPVTLKKTFYATVIKKKSKEPRRR